MHELPDDYNELHVQPSCKKVLKKVDDINKERGIGTWKYPAISSECLLHRFVTEMDLDEERDGLGQNAIKDKGWSVVVTGPSFEKVDLFQEMKRQNEEKSKGFIAVACIKASVVWATTMENNLVPVYDPHSSGAPDPPQNHAMIVCNKTVQATNFILEEVFWTVPPDRSFWWEFRYFIRKALGLSKI